MVIGVSYMDLAFMIILLISGISGAIKGFVRQLFSLLSFVAIIVVAMLLCEWFGGIIYPVFGEAIEGGFADWIRSNDVEGIFTTAQDWTDTAKIDMALSAMGIPALIHKLLSAIIYPTITSFGKEAVLVESLPPVLARWVVNMIAFIAIALIMAIIMFFIKRAVFKAVRRSGLNGINRLLGCVFSLVYTYSVLSLVLMLVSTFVTSIGLFTGVQEFLTSQSIHSQSGWFPIFNFMYHYNFIGEFILKQFLMMIPT